MQAGELMALVIYFSDDYLRLRTLGADPKEGNFGRFFQLAAKLPIELQMVLCNRACSLTHSVILSRDSELGFRKFAKMSFE